MSAAFGFGAAVLMTSACTPYYISYPPVEGDAAFHDLGVTPAPEVMGDAVRFVIERYPLEGSYLVNLPRGTQRRTAEKVVNIVNDSNAWIVNELMLDRPAVHITKVWVRGDRASVDVMRPVGEDVYQTITVRLAQAMGDWKVTGAREFTTGAFEAPPLYGWFGESGGAVVQPGYVEDNNSNEAESNQ